MDGFKLSKSIPTNDLVSINQAIFKELSYNLRMEVGFKHPRKHCELRVDLVEILPGY
jgi:hypothetical protein